MRILFEMFDKTGLGPIVREFNRNKLKVADLEATNKAKRESGFLVKTATLTFESGQRLTLKAKAGGSIFQVLLNKKVLAIKNVNDIDKALEEVISMVKENEVPFKKAQAKRLLKPVIVRKATAGESSSALMAQQIENLNSSIEKHKAGLEVINGELAIKRAENDVKRAMIAELKNKLLIEQHRGRFLQKQHDDLVKAGRTR